jgi:hypothetical protein
MWPAPPRAAADPGRRDCTERPGEAVAVPVGPGRRGVVALSCGVRSRRGRCGAVKDKLPLRARIFRCETCGLTLDRDLNAARNLAALAGQIDVAQSCGETLNALRETGRDGTSRPGGAGVRPTPGGQSAVKRELRKRRTPDRKVTAA